jgi:hypothetical protein
MRTKFEKLLELEISADAKSTTAEADGRGHVTALTNTYETAEMYKTRDKQAHKNKLRRQRGDY